MWLSLRRVGLALGIGLALLVAAGEQGARADPVKVRTGLHDDFARVVFDWRRLPAFHVEPDGATITIRFARPAEFDTAQLRDALDGRIVGATRSADGQSVTIELVRESRIRSFPLGNMAVIDMLDLVDQAAPSVAESTEPAEQRVAEEPASEPAAPEPEPEEAIPTPASAKPAAPQEAVLETTPPVETEPDEATVAEEAVAAAPATVPLPVMARDFDGFSRLIFDWPLAIEYEVVRDGELVLVRFPAGVLLDEAALRSQLPRRFLGISVSPTDEALTLEFSIPDSARVRHFQKGNRVVIDVLDPTGYQTVVRPSWATPDGVAAADTDGIDETAAEEVVDARSAAGDETDAAGQMAEATEQEEQTTSTASTTDANRSNDAAGTTDMPKPAWAASEVDGAPTLLVSTEVIEGGARLRFGWQRRVGAAVFARGLDLWIIFDVARHVPLGRLGASTVMADLVRSAEQVDVAGATVLRFGLAQPLVPRVARSGNAWMVEISERPSQPPASLAVRREPDAPGGGRVVVPLSEAGSTLVFDDPVVGDQLIVVPLAEPGAGVTARQRFVQFSLLETAQGTAILPHSDDVMVAADVDGIEITTRGSLVMSSQADLDSHTPVGDRLDGPRILYPFGQWKRAELGTFAKARQYLQNRVVKAPLAARTGRRIDLARFYVAHGMAADAIGVLNRVAADDDEAGANPDFVSLRGATLMLLNRIDEASGDLESPLLDDAEDITLWRAVVAAGRGEWEAADSAFAISQSAYRRLPEDLQARFGLLAAHAALAVGNYHRAGRIADALNTDTAPAAVRGEAMLVQASIQQHLGEPEAALEILESLSISANRPVRARRSSRGSSFCSAWAAWLGAKRSKSSKPCVTPGAAIPLNRSSCAGWASSTGRARLYERAADDARCGRGVSTSAGNASDPRIDAAGF